MTTFYDVRKTNSDFSDFIRSANVLSHKNVQLHGEA